MKIKSAQITEAPVKILAHSGCSLSGIQDPCSPLRGLSRCLLLQLEYLLSGSVSAPGGAVVLLEKGNHYILTSQDTRVNDVIA